jgi:hypothetical protein
MPKKSKTGRKNKTEIKFWISGSSSGTQTRLFKQEILRRLWNNLQLFVFGISWGDDTAIEF